ncbi:MAG: heme exporter protein CcmD [Pelagibacteraceae bacterium]|jgi:heme exporter protein CcmD
MTEFLNMGGYAVFIWGSYLIAAVLLVVLYARSVRALNALQSKEEVVVREKSTSTIRDKSLA